MILFCRPLKVSIKTKQNKIVLCYTGQMSPWHKLNPWPSWNRLNALAIVGLITYFSFFI